MDNEQARKYIKNVNEAYEKILNESRIPSKDKRAIMSFIASPKKAKYTMQDGEIISVRPTNPGVEFTFDKNNFELSVTIVDIVDSMRDQEYKATPGNIKVLSDTLRRTGVQFQ